MDGATILNLAYAVLGLGIIIFIHELGHFLAAKKVGVRVDTFSVGFDPPFLGRKLRLWSFKKGETEYVIGLVPLGGYVKMAGETQLEAETGGDGRDAPLQPAPDWLIAKPAGARALVFAAGAIFNVISAFLFFIVAFSLGVHFTSTEVGVVVPGEPAWEAGIRAGDRIATIDGRTVEEFHELMVAVAFGDRTAPLRIGLESSDGTPGRQVEVTPEWNAARGFQTIGVSPAIDPAIAGVEEGSPAQAAGLRRGDRLLGFRVGDLECTDFPTVNLLSAALETYTQFNPGAPFDVLYEREGEKHWTSIEPRRDVEAGITPMLGVERIVPLVVDGLQPGSDAASVLRAGDRVLSIDGERFLSPRWNTIFERFPGKDDLRLEVEALDGTVRELTLERQRMIDWSVSNEIAWRPLECRLGEVREGSPLAQAGFQTGDLIERVADRWVSDPQQLAVTLRGRATGGPPTPIGIIREDRRLEEPLAVAEEAFVVLRDQEQGVSWDRSTTVLVLGPGVPAGKIGVKSGSTISTVDGRTISDWDDLLNAVSQSAGKEVALAWRTPSGEVEQGATELAVDTYRSLGVQYQQSQVVIQAEGLLDAARRGMERTVIVAKWVFLTLKGLIKREVAARNLTGVVGIVHLMVLVSEMGLGTLIYYLALISINLGILNLLPIPILDGGHLLFLLIEKIKGSPVSLRVQEIATTAAFFLLIGLAIFVTYHDILRVIGL